MIGEKQHTSRTFREMDGSVHNVLPFQMPVQ